MQARQYKTHSRKVSGFCTKNQYYLCCLFFVTPGGQAAFATGLSDSFWISHLPDEQRVDYWRVRAVPRHEILSVLIAQMGRLAFKEPQILKSIVAANVVDVMHTFFRIQQATEMLFHHGAVLVDVALRVGVRMTRCVAVDVATPVNGSAASPRMILRASNTRLMARGVFQVLALVIAALRLVGLSDLRHLAAATQTQTARIHELNVLPVRSKNSLGFWTSRPMSMGEALTVLHLPSAATFTTGRRDLNSCYACDSTRIQRRKV